MTDFEFFIRDLLQKTPIQKVYLAEMKADQNGFLTPKYFDGQGFVFCGINDTEGVTAYIRQNGDISFEPKDTEGGNYRYLMAQDFKLVVCGKNRTFDNQRAFFRILSLFDNSGFILRASTLDQNALYQTEQPQSPNAAQGAALNPTDLYFSVTFTHSKGFSLTDCIEAFSCYKAKNRFEKCDFSESKRDFSRDFDVNYS